MSKPKSQIETTNSGAVYFHFDNGRSVRAIFVDGLVFAFELKNRKMISRIERFGADSFADFLAAVSKKTA